MYLELVHIFQKWRHVQVTSHDKTTGKTFLTSDSEKCLHYYFYFIDKVFGLCYLRVPTWAPFRLQFYYNGHNYLARKHDAANIAYTIRENVFTLLDNCEKAHALSHGFRVDDLKQQALDIFASRYCSVIKKFELAYLLEHYAGRIRHRHYVQKREITWAPSMNR